MTPALASVYAAELYGGNHAVPPLLLQSQNGRTREERRRAWEALQWLDPDNDVPPPENAAEAAARAIGIYLYLALLHDRHRLRALLFVVNESVHA